MHGLRPIITPTRLVLAMKTRTKIGTDWGTGLHDVLSRIGVMRVR